MVDRDQLKRLGWPEELIKAAEAVARDLRGASQVPPGRGSDEVTRGIALDRVTIDEHKTSASSIRLEAMEIPPGRHSFL